LQPIPGGAAARPLSRTTLLGHAFIRVLPMNCQKRLIVGGFEGVYEFSKNFRNEEWIVRTTRTMEIYVPNYNWMMVEDLLRACVDQTLEKHFGAHKIN
jgi:lysyl-tRNA synthetase class 2